MPKSVFLVSCSASDYDYNSYANLVTFSTEELANLFVQKCKALHNRHAAAVIAANNATEHWLIDNPGTSLLQKPKYDGRGHTKWDNEVIRPWKVLAEKAHTEYNSWSNKKENFKASCISKVENFSIQEEEFVEKYHLRKWWDDYCFNGYDVDEISYHEDNI